MTGKPTGMAGFGARVRAARECKGWTQEHLASACGRSEKTVRRLEAGEPVQGETVMAVCAVLDVPGPDAGSVPRRPESTMPDPCDEAHAAILAALFHEAKATRGARHVTASDAGAYLADAPVDEAKATAWRRRRARWERAMRITGIAAAVLVACAAPAPFVWLLAEGRGRAPAGLVGAWHALVTAAVMAMVATMGAMMASSPREPGWLGERDRRRASAEAMRRTAYAFGTEGIDVLEARGWGVVRSHRATALIASIAEVRRGAHSDVVARMVGWDGAITLGWLPASETLTRAVADLAEAIAART